MNTFLTHCHRHVNFEHTFHSRASVKRCAVIKNSCKMWMKHLTQFPQAVWTLFRHDEKGDDKTTRPVHLKGWGGVLEILSFELWRSIMLCAACMVSAFLLPAIQCKFALIRWSNIFPGLDLHSSDVGDFQRGKQSSWKIRPAGFESDPLRY